MPQCRQLTEQWHDHPNRSKSGVRVRYTQAPNLVVRAYWNGAVARSTAVANCWEIVRATNRRMMSPATMPLTPPDGFCNAVNRPRRTTSTISSGTTALERSCANRQNRVVSSTLSEADASDHSSCPMVPRLHLLATLKFFANLWSKSNQTPSR